MLKLNYAQCVAESEHARAYGKRATSCLRAALAWRNGNWLPAMAPSITAEVSATILPDGRWQAFVRDISDRKRLQQERDSASAQLTQVLAVTTDAVFSLDRNWRITYLNRRAQEILSPRGNVLGTVLWKSFPAAFYEGSPYVENYYRAMNQGVPGDFEAYYPDPLNLWLHVSARPANDGIIVFFRDITEQKRAAAVLIQSEKLAAVGRLASSIAHEINNPLEAVTNLLYLGERAATLDENKQYLATAQQELARVTIIATQTLRFHRQSTNPHDTSLQELFDDVLTLFQGRINGMGIIVERQYRADPKIVAFAGDLRQVFANLISNSLDACSRGGKIVVRLRSGRSLSGQEGVRVTVTDTGVGIAPETRRHIFEPFFTTKSATGTGLGLWVSSEILKNHRATVRVRSSQSPQRHGTVFSIFFPTDAAKNNRTEASFILQKKADPQDPSQARYLDSGNYCGGSSTVSITWMTPLVAITSALITVASFTITLPPAVLIVSSCPPTVFTECSLTTCFEVTSPATTWYSRIAFSFS